MTLEELNNARPELKGCICLNQKQTAEIIGVSSSTLDNWRKIGLGPQYKKIDSGKREEFYTLKLQLLNGCQVLLKQHSCPLLRSCLPNAKSGLIQCVGQLNYSQYVLIYY